MRLNSYGISTLAILLAMIILPACQPGLRRASQQEIIAGARRIGAAAPVSREELGQLNSAFADRYVLMMATACDQIKNTSVDPMQRRRAQEIKTNSAESVYDIVTNADPYTQLLDLTAAVTLQSIQMIDEDEAESAFGAEKGALLIRATRKARLEIWDIAARVLTDEQLENLDFMIWDYRRQNPEVSGVINVRFSDFAGSRSKSMAEEGQGSGIFGQIDQARQSVDEARILAERAFFYSKRAPLLLAWRTEATIDQILVKPEVREVLASLDNASKAADKIAVVAEKLPDTVANERKEILAALDARQGTLTALVKQVQGALTDANTLTVSGKDLLVELQKASVALQALIKDSDQAVARFVPMPSPQAAAPTPAGAPAQPVSTPPTAAAAAATPPAASSDPGHPFDIRDYTKALAELGSSAKELDRVVVSSNNLLGSEAWKARIDEINSAADGRVELAAARSRALVDTIFTRVYIAIGILCVALIAARVISSHLMGKGSNGARP